MVEKCSRVTRLPAPVLPFPTTGFTKLTIIADGRLPKCDGACARLRLPIRRAPPNPSLRWFPTPCPILSPASRWSRVESNKWDILKAQDLWRSYEEVDSSTLHLADGSADCGSVQCARTGRHRSDGQAGNYSRHVLQQARGSFSGALDPGCRDQQQNCDSGWRHDRR